jgi:transcriptional regulator with XRE-family HTH domain
METKVFDINSFLCRSNFTQNELAEKVGRGVSAVGMWASGKNYPTFENCIKLIELGMTIEEMFGTELLGKARIYLNEPEKEPENENDFERRVCDVLIKHLSGGVK